jgi:hypothetical protein
MSQNKRGKKKRPGRPGGTRQNDIQKYHRKKGGGDMTREAGKRGWARRIAAHEQIDVFVLQGVQGIGEERGYFASPDHHVCVQEHHLCVCACMCVHVYACVCV